MRPQKQMGKLADRLDDAERFFRGSFFGYTWMLVLLGAGSANADPSGAQIVVLVLVGLNYHFFGYVHNDLIDLPVDRTQPLRSRDPLVTGRIGERQAWVFALVQIPISCLLALSAGAGADALAVLAVGYTATVVYNVYGKRCPVPMITDAVQGIAWGSLALFGALLVGKPTLLTLIPVGFGFGFIFLINGVHGGLRDLENDFKRGRVTTSIYLGARPTDSGLVRSTRTLQSFAVFAFVIVLAPAFWVVVSGALPYGGAAYWIAIGSWLMVNSCSAYLLWQVVKSEQPDRLKYVYQHQLPLLVPPLLVMLPGLGWRLQMAVLVCFFVPFFLFIPRVRSLGNYLRKQEAHPKKPV